MFKRPHKQSRLPALLTLAAGLGLCAFAACALFVPGFVLGAEGEVVQPPAVTDPTDPSANTTDATAGKAPETAADAGSTTDASPIDEADTAASAPPVDRPAGTELVTLPWGEGPGAVGLALPGEGLARGPEALVVAPDGRIVILDSVNRRLVVLQADGAFADAWPLGLAEPRFLAVDLRCLYVLDADADKTLVSLDWTGSETGRAALPPLDDVVTGLFATERGACIEVAHEKVFLAEAAAAKNRPSLPGRAAPAALSAIAGRPLGGDLGLAAKITFRPNQGVKITSYRIDGKSLKATQVGSVQPALVAGRALEHLISADADGSGGLIIGARLLGGGSGGPASLAVVRLKTAAGGTVGSTPSDIVYLDDFPFAYVGLPYSVAPDGRVFQPMPTVTGYTILVHEFPRPKPASAPDNVSAPLAAPELPPSLEEVRP